MSCNQPTEFTAFLGETRLACGALDAVALAVKAVSDPPPPVPIVIIDDRSGRAIDLDLRGSHSDILARLPQPGVTLAPAEEPSPRGRGRPKLGVVAREVTLLPRHWDWLNARPGGASVALRRLVDEARRASGDADRVRAARDAAYHAMSLLAGNLPGFEEASRALFAGDRARFTGLVAHWPADIRDYVIKLAFRDQAATAT